jgi:ABC-2 type transport system ATP-binding protein
LDNRSNNHHEKPVGPPLVIQASGLTKEFGDQVAVKDVVLQIPQGTIFGLIGPSGCGKTTTVRLLTGVLKPTSGQVTVFNEEPGKFSPASLRRIGYMPQHFVLYPGLTVWQNLNFSASLYGMGLRRGEAMQRLLDFVELAQHRHKSARDISGGMQRRLALASTLVHNPRLLFLDEPTAGIDPVLRRKFWDYFKDLQAEGRTLFVTTQYVGEAAYCDLVGVMDEGRLVYMETPAGLRHRAYGGDMVDLRATGSLDRRVIDALTEQDFVQGRVSRLDGSSVRLVVNEASTAIPALMDWAKAHSLAVASVEEYSPPLDDVFVELMRRAQREKEAVDVG